MRRLPERCARIVPKRVLITRIPSRGPLGRVVAARSTQDFGARLRVHRLRAAFLDEALCELDADCHRQFPCEIS